MTEKTVTIVNKLGMHARPASLLVQTVSKFESVVKIIKDETEANARSIMSVMMLAAEKGSQLLIQADGPDEQDVLDAIEKLVADKFNED